MSETESSPLSQALMAAVKAVRHDVPKEKLKALAEAAVDACGALDRQYARVTKMQAASIAAGTVGRKAIDFDVEKAKQLRSEGKSYAAISKELGVPASRIQRRLAGGATVGVTDYP